MAKGDDIVERLIDFAVRIINVCNHLPASPAGKHIANHKCKLKPGKPCIAHPLMRPCQRGLRI